MQYQIIGENMDGTTTVRVLDGEDFYDIVVVVPPVRTFEENVREAVAAELAKGTVGEPVIATLKELPDGSEITQEEIDLSKEPTP